MKELVGFFETYKTIIIIVLGILNILVPALVQLVPKWRKSRREKKEKAPRLEPFLCLGDLGGFNFSLRNEGGSSVKIYEPEYNKELLGEFNIRAEYLFNFNPKGHKGVFEFSKSKLAPEEEIIIIFTPKDDIKTYTGEWKAIISYEGDSFKRKTKEIPFKVDTDTKEIKPLNF